VPEDPCLYKRRAYLQSDIPDQSFTLRLQSSGLTGSIGTFSRDLDFRKNRRKVSLDLVRNSLHALLVHISTLRSVPYNSVGIVVCTARYRCHCPPNLYPPSRVWSFTSQIAPGRRGNGLPVAGDQKPHHSYMQRVS
jgi:hypothetical protein